MESVSFFGCSVVRLGSGLWLCAPPPPGKLGDTWRRLMILLCCGTQLLTSLPATGLSLFILSMIRLFLKTKQNKTNDYRTVEFPSSVPTLSPNQTIDTQNISCHKGRASPASVCFILDSNCIFQFLSLNFLFQ